MITVITLLRNVNGTCNNCDNPLWGSVTDKIGRLLEPVFEDDAESLPRGWNQGLGYLCLKFWP